jgi:2-oxoglutarate dehydrogenase E1 component
VSEPTDLRPPPARPTALNPDYLDQLYARWREEPDSLSSDWQAFFQGFELASCSRPCQANDFANKQSAVSSLIYAYRSRGHLAAHIDPLSEPPEGHPDLELAAFDLEEADLDQVFDTGHMPAPKRMRLRDIIGLLRDTYCRALGVEYVHIQEAPVRRWLQRQMEPLRNRPPLYPERRLEILRLLNDAELFETFVQTRYPGQKRFSLEGAEALIPAIHELVELAPDLGVEEIVLGMAHRGRLNVLANILDKSYAMIFSEFSDVGLRDVAGGDGDVKYHRGYSSDHESRRAKTVHLSLTSNPSHLEAVDPVVEGRARAKQRQRGDTVERSKVVPVLIHGDAAFAGQGMVAETLNLSQLRGYRTGGTVHLVVNNQIGFTTSPQDARSSRYATDIAKFIEAPIFHVNGDDPEAVVFATELALRFRQRWKRDVVVDMLCYRRHGHNEGDEPRFTQPVLYRKLKDHPSVRRLYRQRLLDERIMDQAHVEAFRREFQERLQLAFDQVKAGEARPEIPAYDRRWRELDGGWTFEPGDTAVTPAALETVARALTTPPPDFELNHKVARRLPALAEAVQGLGTLDWAQAEALAMGTLVLEGTKVRLSGQDSARGTFSQRHAIWRDPRSSRPYFPLQHVASGQATFKVYNSLLSEAAVLGFEYGYSLAEPDALILWEAQFGDFANGAQVIIDQFIVPAEAKWQRSSGLVMLLPHGYEGQGPEHSNAYLERYLLACAEENIQVMNLTTPAQYFHALRRQARRPFRKPLVLMAPKSMLRHPRAVSPVSELMTGAFRPFEADSSPPAGATRRLVLVSGKLFYELDAARQELDLYDVAILRVEQLYPFDDAAFERAVAPHRGARELVWCQEEPQNRGAWTHMAPLLARLFPNQTARYVGRPASASPATGSLRVHRETQAALIRDALIGPEGA